MNIWGNKILQGFVFGIMAIFIIYQWIDTDAAVKELKLRVTEFVAEYNALAANNEEWKIAYTTLKTDNEECETAYNTLKAQLDSTQADLSNTDKLLLDSEIQLDKTKAELDLTDTRLAMTTNQLETARNNNSQMLSQYASLKEQVIVRLGISHKDRQSFITPNNSIVSSKVRSIAGSYSEDTEESWSDYRRLYAWVVSNITYSSDGLIPVLPQDISGELTWAPECWQTPEETIVAEVGDCEDMAVLLASMLLSYNEGKFGIWLLGISNGEVGHLAVAFPVQGDNLSILDPAGNYYTGYQYGPITQESKSIAVRRWLSNWNREMPGAEVVEVFSEDFYEEFSGTDEFLTWLEER